MTAGCAAPGAQVVMSHELVHVFTDAVRSPVEPWLLEGFADYVALRDVQPAGPRHAGAGDRRRASRRGAATACRRRRTSTPAPRTSQARYEEAWLACRIIAERLGERALVEVYDAADRGEPVATALSRAGLAPRRLVRTWQAQLRRLAG